jgi:CPA2 family monovalent cation:H+ antiporter-2
VAAHVPQLILDFATVLGVAAGTGLLCRRLRQPAVLGYLLAGLIVGPYVPVPIAVHAENVRTLAELGVVLLLFCVGLEFDFRKLLRKGPAAAVMGVVQLGFTSWLGFMVGRGLGWSVAQSAFMGAALAISSTMIIAKLFEEEGVKGGLRDAVLAVLVVQDLFAILLLAGFDATLAAGTFGLPGLLRTLGRVALFLGALLGGGGLVVPRLLRWAADQGRDETLLVASVGLCFASAVLAATAGCSLALGAFLAGLLAGGSGRSRRIEHLVLPLRDMFSAIFFVAVGMMLDPAALLAQLGPILAFTTVVLLGDSLATTLGATLAGQPLRIGLRAGLALAQPGEFSFVLVTMGISSGLLPATFFPVAAGVCLVNALAGPWLFRQGDALATALEHRIPDRAHWYLKAYQGWAEKLGRPRGPSPLRGPLLFLLLDAALINLTVIGVWYLKVRTPWFQDLGASAGLLLLAGALAILSLLAWALYRRAGEIAEAILDAPLKPGAPPPAGRRQLLAALRAALVLIPGIPSLALLQPFLPEGPMLALLSIAFLGLLLLVRSQSRRFPWEQAMGSQWLLHRVQAPWQDGAPDPAAPVDLSLRLGAQCPFLGRTLGDLALEDFAGVTVLSLLRAGTPLVPHPHTRLQPEDILALRGPGRTLQAVEALVTKR